MLDNVTVSDLSGRKTSFDLAVAKVVKTLKAVNNPRGVILIGNGGSAGIAAEVANRLWKFCGVKAMTFNDPVILTSTANDHGWERVFEKPMAMHAGQDDVLIAISSGGKSKNILKGVVAARRKGCTVFTLSGFEKNNPLKSKGDVNFFVPSKSYRHVERTHLFILDCIIDLLIETQENRAHLPDLV